MTIAVNGDAVDARGATTIAELVTQFELQPAAVLIEHNGVALHRREWPQTPIGAGDRIEFIRVVAGG